MKTQAQSGIMTVEWTWGSAQIPMILTSSFDFHNVLIEFRLWKNTCFIKAEVTSRTDRAKGTIGVEITKEFLQDIGVDFSQPHDDEFVKDLVHKIENSIGWRPMYNNYNKPQKINMPKNFYKQDYHPHQENDSQMLLDEIEHHVKKEKERNELIIKELQEHIQELKEELEMVKAINQEC